MLKKAAMLHCIKKFFKRKEIQTEPVQLVIIDKPVIQNRYPHPTLINARTQTGRIVIINQIWTVL